MVVRLPVSQRRILRGIGKDLARSDPQLVRLFTMFTWLTRGADMPGAEQVKAGPVRMLTRPTPTAGPGRPLENRLTWLWTTLLLFTLVLVLPHSFTTSAKAHCAVGACAQPVKQHPHTDQRHAARQVAHCLVHQSRPFTSVSCLS